MASKKSKENSIRDDALKGEIISIVAIAALLYLFLCNFGIGGKAGAFLSNFMFGVFGVRAYLAPLLILDAILLYFMIFKGQGGILRKIIAGWVLFLLLGVLIDLVTGRMGVLSQGIDIVGFYERGVTLHKGGGILADIIGGLMYKYLSATGTVLLVLVFAIICLIILTDGSVIRTVKEGSQQVIENAGEDYRQMKVRRQRERVRERKRRKKEAEEREKRRAAEEAEAARRQEEKEIEKQRREDDKIVRRVKKSGVTFDTDLRADGSPAAGPFDDAQGPAGASSGAMGASPTAEPVEAPGTSPVAGPFDDAQGPAGASPVAEPVETRETSLGGDDIHEITFVRDEKETMRNATSEGLIRKAEGAEDFKLPSTKEAAEKNKEEVARGKTQAKQNAVQTVKKRKYSFPPLSLLAKSEKKKTGQGSASLKETADKLEKILQTFNVNAKVVDYSQGPTVTRYELQPEVGVKVSRILNLADDIKLNLAATDIRIEAPIPGKVAVGIEVPNPENVTVTLRELLEDKTYQSAASRLSFAVGKDIAGETIVADIAKMPHLLIAGATGSGKSVCINTLVLSLLYKAHPDEVKLIMVDPKVVELNMYNGIPHLLIPVVTDPKKAAGALNWAVAEMEKRYRLFADAEVRDLEGYNKYVELHQGEEGYEKLPQIVLIVDELADLMMVSKSEVETAICRLAQLARAAGIHLIIATQRPSVDVITGLIKANMPSRIAFAVSSGVDSRTILDMNGAEKLLGKGDMLFFPQNYSKPVRVQGAFVSDKEIQDVCDYLKKQQTESYNEQIVSDIEKMQAQSASAGADASAAGAGTSDGRDAYFEEAGRFIIGKEKASIGNLQRVFKIGFNRAARIMDQLCEAGVVGEEEGTKPRRILMTMEEFDALMAEKEAS